jgi:C1A family cysteine protease
MEANMVKAGAVQLNKLAQDRINEERQKRGLIPLNLPLVPHGEEVLPRGSRVVASVSSAALPAAVDNSTLPSFPPVRDQGNISSCASFSTTYYVGTHMLGLARGWDNRNENNATKLSPKWTYPMVNDGQDSGSWFTPTIEVLLKHGGATWVDWPYSRVNTPSSYREWNRSASVWRSAINNRMAQSGKVQNVHTSVGLQNLKTLLANGYALLYATDIDGWQYTTISDDPSTTSDDAFMGKRAVAYMQAKESGHAMTVVGYNDNIWIDLNKNGIVDPGEKGALRICNSWGADWEDGGFMWIAYDALRTTTAVAGVTGQTSRAPAASSLWRTPWWHNEAYWFTAQPAYIPKLLAQFTLNHKYRSDLRVRVGVSATSTTSPSAYFDPGALQNHGGGYAFNGTTTAVNGTFVFDCSDIATSGSRRYYLSIADNTTGNTASVSDFRLTDAAGNTLAVATTGIPGTADNSTTLAYVDYSLNAPVISSATNTIATVGTAFSFQIVASGATTFSASGLPPGLAINGVSGLISGTPTQAGTFIVRLSASSGGGSGSGTLTIVVSGSAVSPPVITSAATATGTVGTAFTYNIVANGSPTSYGASGLPSGLTVDTATGVVSGTPALPGTFQVGLSAVNAGGTGARTLTLTINPAPISVPVITSAATASVNAGSAFSYRITASNSPTSFGADGLPAELTVNSTSGVISGTLTLARQYAVTLRAINASGTGYKNLLLTVLGDSSFGPANDGFANRAALSGTNVSVTGGNVNATAQTGEPNHAGYTASKSVWWTWTAPVSGVVTLDTIGSSFDTVLAVYTGSAVTNLTGVASDDDGGGNRTSRLTFNAVAGTIYQIAVDGYAGQSGSINLNLLMNGSVSPPSNDSFGSALTLTGALVFTGGRNTGASAESGEPNHAGFTARKSVWWNWTAPASGPVFVGTGGSSFDTVLAVYTGSSVSALTLVASDDQSGGNNTSLLTFSAVSGVTYRIAVDGFLGDEGSIVLGLQQLGSAPANDNFQNAAALSGFNPTASGVNTNATAQAGEPNHAGYPARKSVWWAWTAPASGLAQIATTGSTFDTVLAVYSGSALGSLVTVASDDDSGGNLTSKVTFTATAGTIYRIAVDGFSGASGTVALSLVLTATPANDNFANRIVLSGTNFTANGANVNATAQSGEPAHAGSTAVKSVWWSWTAPTGGWVTFRTAGSAFDTVLAVYTGGLVGNLSPVAANDDEPGALTSSVSFIAMAGVTYQIAVDSYSGASGTIVLSGALVVDPDVLYETDFETFSSGSTTITSVDGWVGINAGAGAHGIITALDSRAAYLGFNPPSSGSSVFLYRPVNFQPVAQGRPIVTFSVEFSITDSTSANGQYDDFGFSIYNRSGQLLATIRLDNSNLRIYYNNGAASDVDTGRQFSNATRHRLTFTANFASNLWSATFNGTALFTSIPLNTVGRTLDLGDVDILWRLKNANAPGDNYIIFDNYSLSANAVPVAPTITVQPLATTNTLGGAASFNVTATGTPPFRYQWRFNGAAITGETNATLNLLNLTTNQAGLYSVVVSNSVGLATSQIAALTVLPPAPTTVLGPPVVTDRGLQFHATGTPGRSFKFEASADLVNWQEISTVLNQNGSLIFLDPTATNAVRKFYRIRDAN